MIAVTANGKHDQEQRPELPTAGVLRGRAHGALVSARARRRQPVEVARGGRSV